jgi:hypothetical protein
MVGYGAARCVVVLAQALSLAGGCGIPVGRMGLPSVGHEWAEVVQLVLLPVVVAVQRRANALLPSSSRGRRRRRLWRRYLLEGVVEVVACFSIWEELQAKPRMRVFRVETCEATTMVMTKVWWCQDRVSRLRFGVSECVRDGILSL